MSDLPDGVVRNRVAARRWRAELERTNLEAGEMMREAQQRRSGEAHSDHCWARIAWGDGECECNGNTRALDTMTAAHLGIEGKS